MFHSRAFAFSAALLLCFLSSVKPAEGFWDRNGNLVSGGVGSDLQPRIVGDGAGGMIVVWRDDAAQARAQRMDGSGAPVWAAGGIIVGSAAYEILGLVPDEVGGAIVVWFESPVDRIVAARISPDGSLVWPSGSIEIASSGEPTNLTVAPDGSGGAFIAWLDAAGSMRGRIQKVDRNGNELWTSEGLQYSTKTQPNDADYRPDLVADGAGGALIAFVEEGTPSNVWVERVYANESTWSTQANYTSGLGSSGHYPSLASDGAGGAVVAWVSDIQSVTRIDLQILDPAGNRVLANPVSVSGGLAEEHADIDMTCDGVGGGILSWREFRDGRWRVCAQRVDAFGHRIWDEDGLLVSPDSNLDCEFPRILRSASGEVIVSWVDDDYRVEEHPLRARKLDPGGAFSWGPDLTLVLPNGYDDDYDVAADGSGGLLAAIPRVTAPGEVDVYGQGLNIFGLPAAPEPVVQSVTDVPLDQGGWVRISVDASDRDCLAQTEAQVSSYDVWQRVDGPLLRSPSASLSEQEEVSPGSGLLFFRDGDRRFVSAAASGVFPTGTWELVGSFGASQADEYIYRAPTLVDSSGHEDNYSVFTIAAMTTDPSVWFVSAPDSGCSVDNLAPAPPMALAGAQTFAPEGLQLTWDPNTENDLWYYAVYRGTGTLPVPSMAQLVATPQGPEYFDEDWDWQAGFWYLVSAVDIHGNESAHAILSHENVTGVGSTPGSNAMFLAQNYPNPFNPSTTIAFGLEEGEFVDLRIYDAAGRLVDVLVSEARPAGLYTEAWKGRSRSGSDAASGVYYYKLTVGDSAKTRKMILLR